MSSYTERITKIVVGAQPDDAPEEKVEVTFNDFADLSTEKGHAVTTPKFECFGRQWTLTIYPGGTGRHISGTAPSPDGHVAVFLTLCTPNDEITVDYEFSICDDEDEDEEHTWCGSDTFGGRGNITIRGTSDYMELSTISDELLDDDGDLILEVSMSQRFEGHNYLGCDPFVPQNPFMRNMQRMFPFMDKESSDVLFQLNGGKYAYPAHTIILKACAPELARFCENKKNSSKVVIPDVRQPIFYQVLRYIYGLPVPITKLKSNAREIIDAADRYEVVGLKIEAEIWLCKETKIGTNNVMENLHYAESKNLALLKEAVMQYFLNNGKEVVSKIKLEELPSSSQHFRDILTAVMTEKEADDTDGNVTDIKAMSVNSLRMNLDEKGLSVDGTREMLVKALENHDKGKGTKRSWRDVMDYDENLMSISDYARLSGLNYS